MLAPPARAFAQGGEKKVLKKNLFLPISVLKVARFCKFLTTFRSFFPACRKNLRA